MQAICVIEVRVLRALYILNECPVCIAPRDYTAVKWLWNSEEQKRIGMRMIDPRHERGLRRTSWFRKRALSWGGYLSQYSGLPPGERHTATRRLQLLAK